MGIDAGFGLSSETSLLFFVRGFLFLRILSVEFVPTNIVSRLEVLTTGNVKVVGYLSEDILFVTEIQ